MPSITQPEGMTMNKGFVITIGIVVNNDRTAITFPVWFDGDPTDENDVGQAAVNAVEEHILPLITPLISSDAYMSFVQAEGMLVGWVPSRTSYDSSNWPGGGSAGAMPSATSGLIVFYEDARDITDDAKKIGIGKIFVPGIPRDIVVGDAIDESWVTDGLALALKLQNGYHPPTIETSLTFYRVLSKPTKDPPNPAPGPDTVLNRVFACAARGYVATQRRRLIPR